jgi:hypothetical protein
MIYCSCPNNRTFSSQNSYSWAVALENCAAQVNKNAPAVEQARIILHSTGAKRMCNSKNKPSKSWAYYTPLGHKRTRICNRGAAAKTTGGNMLMVLLQQLPNPNSLNREGSF